MPGPSKKGRVAKPKKPPHRASKGVAQLTRKNPAVDVWFEGLDHPLKPLMMRVRRMILGSDSRVSESIKWSTPTFSYNGDIASFIPSAKAFVSLLFHRGAEIPGHHPRLEGDSRLTRTMRFTSPKDLERYAGDLRRAIRAWCDHKSK